MNTNYIIVIVAVALGLGYLIGHENGTPAFQPHEFSINSENLTTPNAETVIAKPDVNYDFQDQNIKRQLEEARNSAQATRDEAQSRAFATTMELMHSGKPDDMIRMNEANSSATRAQETLNNINDALSKTNR